MSVRFACVDCGNVQELREAAWRCPACGGIYNVEETRADLPFAPVTLGEGQTPLVRLHPQSEQVLLKLEYLMPTLSFKDRGAAVLIGHALYQGATKVIADSSGNAGSAMAAYAARAGLACDVYVPESTPPRKLRQMAAHGATIHAVPGTREEVARAAMEAVEREGAFYASHVWNPLFLLGTKRYAYEVYQQLGGRAPETLVVPVGNGTLLLGAYLGFQELRRAGRINRLPRLLAVQAERCAPLAEAWRNRSAEVPVVQNRGTVADGIAIGAPARGKQILAAVRETDGVIVPVSESSIERARRDLAERGFFVEPTSACTYAGYRDYVAHYLGSAEETVVIPLCGAGVKV